MGVQEVIPEIVLPKKPNTVTRILKVWNMVFAFALP